MVGRMVVPHEEDREGVEDLMVLSALSAGLLVDECKSLIYSLF
jgi:hypothetical protein